MQILAKMSDMMKHWPPWIVRREHEDAGKEAEKRNEPRVRDESPKDKCDSFHDLPVTNSASAEWAFYFLQFLLKKKCADNSIGFPVALNNWSQDNFTSQGSKTGDSKQAVNNFLLYAESIFRISFFITHTGRYTFMCVYKLRLENGDVLRKEQWGIGENTEIQHFRI